MSRYKIARQYMAVWDSDFFFSVSKSFFVCSSTGMSYFYNQNFDSESSHDFSSNDLGKIIPSLLIWNNNIVLHVSATNELLKTNLWEWEGYHEVRMQTDKQEKSKLKTKICFPECWGGDGNRGSKVGVRWRNRVLTETTGIWGASLRQTRNLEQWELSAIYKGQDPET